MRRKSTYGSGTFTLTYSVQTTKARRCHSKRNTLTVMSRVAHRFMLTDGILLARTWHTPYGKTSFPDNDGQLTLLCGHPE